MLEIHGNLRSYLREYGFWLLSDESRLKIKDAILDPLVWEIDLRSYPTKFKSYLIKDLRNHGFGVVKLDK